MPRPKLTPEQKLISQQKRREYRKNWMANQSDEKKADRAVYKANWDERHPDANLCYTDDHHDRTRHYWLCDKVGTCDRCDAVAAWNKDRIEKGLMPAEYRALR